MHFGLDDVDRTGARIANTVGAVALQVVQGDGGGHHGIHDALGDLVHLPVCALVQDGWVGHQVTHIAQEQQRTAMQCDVGFALGRLINTVGIQAAFESAAAFADIFGERAFQNTQPVAVSQQFVFSIHGGHRVFQVEDGRQSRFDHQIAHAGWVAGTNRVLGVDLNVQMQAVMNQQNRRRMRGLALVADKLLGVSQATGFAALQ